MNGKSDKNFISIPKRAMFGIAPAIAIIAVLLSKAKPGEALLFLIGIVLGVVIGMGFGKIQK
jgi:hypothetical protein